MKTQSAALPQTNLSEHQNLGAGRRVLIYSHDTFGLGHLQRCLKISRALMERFPRLATIIATGSPVVHRYHLPPGVDYVKLPAVRKIGPGEYEARMLATSYERIISVRTSILTGLVETFQPHVLLVDHSPSGMNGEMLPALQWLDKNLKSCVKIVGLRDIVDDPDAVHASWTKGGIYDLLQNLYEHVLIYGSQGVYDTASEYRFPETIRQKTIYCNYIPEATGAEEPELRQVTASARKQVVVTIGGGDGAGETVIGTFLEMLRKYRSTVNFDTVILPGPFLPEELNVRFRETAKDLPVIFNNFVESTTPYFRSSDLVVATAGYNSISQILEAGRRALIIPRILHRHEQLIRAERLAKMGVVDLIRPEEVTVDLLYAEVTRLLQSAYEPLTEARKKKLIQLDGSERVVNFLSGVFANMEIPEVDNE